MSHTEGEASKLWCPMARVRIMQTGLFDVQGGNREVNFGDNKIELSPPAARCIARRCAMWRWSTPDQHYSDDGKPMGEPLGAARRGFCGLAG